MHSFIYPKILNNQKKDSNAQKGNVKQGIEKSRKKISKRYQTTREQYLNYFKSQFAQTILKVSSLVSHLLIDKMARVAIFF
jgi:hypothetical protein